MFKVARSCNGNSTNFQCIFCVYVFLKLFWLAVSFPSFCQKGQRFSDVFGSIWACCAPFRKNTSRNCGVREILVLVLAGYSTRGTFSS